MEIEKNKSDGILHLSVTGRLDAEGAGDLEHDLNDFVKQGEHHIILDLEKTNYISSAGIRVLLMFRKELSAIDGSFSVTTQDDSEIYRIIKMVGLTDLLTANTEKPAEKKKKSYVRDNYSFEIIEQHKGGFSVSPVGIPEKLKKGVFDENDVSKFKFPAGTMTLGIGSLGNSFDECRKSFGEFIALGGAAITLPPASAAVDYMLTHEQIIPEGCLLNGLRLTGEFETVFHFTPVEKDFEAITLTGLCNESLELVDGDCAAIAAAVEVGNLVGAALIKSPVEKSEDENIFDFPGIRDWLSFTGEPVHNGTIALLSGLVSKTADILPHDFLKPIESSLYGKFKAAVFSYGPISRHQSDLVAITNDIFARHQLIDLLHLVNDSRTLLGVGQSRFLRGTVWAGKVDGGAK